MKRWSWVVVLLVLAGMIALPAYGEDRLKVTGYMDNHISWHRNMSRVDDDLTTDDDDRFMGRTRNRIFFHVTAAPETMMVFALEFDQYWGERPENVTYRDICRDPCGADLGMDNTVTELKHLYLQFRVPTTPVVLKVGGSSFRTPQTKSCILMCVDAPGVQAEITASPKVTLRLYYINAQEEFDTIDGKTLGEDYIMGTMVRLKPTKALNLDLFGVFMHESGPDFDTPMRRFVGGGVRRVDRWWIGFEAAARLGNFTFEPTFIYEGGTREFGPGQSDGDINAYAVDLRGTYKVGRWALMAHFYYATGDEASNDLGPGQDMDGFTIIWSDGVTYGHRWLEIMGTGYDSTTGQWFGDSRDISGQGTFDQFGLIHGALRADYKVTKLLTLGAVVGFTATAEDVGPPARLGGCGTPAGCNNATFDYTGDSNYLGTEVNLTLSYQIFPKATVNAFIAHAFMGDALNLQHPGEPERSSKDITAIGGRIIYRY